MTFDANVNMMKKQVMVTKLRLSISKCIVNLIEEIDCLIFTICNDCKYYC